MATIGRHDAVTELANGWRFSGPIGWLAWLGLHLVYLIGFRNRLNVFDQLGVELPDLRPVQPHPARKRAPARRGCPPEWCDAHLRRDCVPRPRRSAALRLPDRTSHARRCSSPCPPRHGRTRPADRARRRRPRRGRRPTHRCRRPERRGQVDAAAGAGGPGAARPRPCRTHAADGDRGLPPAGAQSVRHRDGAGVPRPPDRRRRGQRPSWSRRRTPSPPAAAGADDRYSQWPSSAGWRSAASTTRPGSARSGPSSAWTTALLEQPTAIAVGRRGGQGQPGRAVAGPLRRVPARRADQRPRPRRPRPPGAVGRRAARPPWCSSATTARSSPAR